MKRIKSEGENKKRKNRATESYGLISNYLKYT